jgi:hypothetical protein
MRWSRFRAAGSSLTAEREIDEAIDDITVFDRAALHVRRAKKGKPAVHPIRGLANDGIDTRAIPDWLGHVSITHTTRYTALSPTRFKDFWRD